VNKALIHINWAKHVEILLGMDQIRINLMGEFQCLSRNGQALDITLAKDQGLIAILLLSEGYSCPRSKLIDLLWSDRSEEQARASLRQCLWSLKKMLGSDHASPLQTDRKRISLDGELIQSDVAEYRKSCDSVDSDELLKALTLYRGDLMAELVIRDREWDEWLTLERENLRSKQAGLLCTLIDLSTVDPSAVNLIEYGRRLLELDPFHEQGYRALMLGYAASGQQTLALRQYEQCRELLQRELGSSPAKETHELYLQIKAGEGDAVVADSPAKNDEAESLVDLANDIPVLELPDKPSIAVLPFTNMSGDEEQEYFSDGITEDIITELSRFGAIFVVARNSSFAFRGDSVDIRKVGQSLGVRFVLEGSVRIVKNRVRITAQLVDASTTDHVWAERYDRDLADIFLVQDEISRAIVSTIIGRIEDFDVDRISNKPTENLSAYENVLRGQKLMHNYTREDYLAACSYFEKAIALDPGFARAHAWLAYFKTNAYFWDLTAEALNLAIQAADAALALDDHESKGHLAVGVARLFRGEHDKAEYHLHRAAELNPNDDLIMIEKGRYLMYTNEALAGAVIVRQAMRQNPYHPNWYWNILGRCLHTAKHYEEAISALKRISTPQFWNHAYMAACYSELGKPEQAAIHIKKVLSQKTDFTISEFTSALPYRDQKVLEEFIAGFHQAGLPE
jgi:TolB-like protein